MCHLKTGFCDHGVWKLGAEERPLSCVEGWGGWCLLEADCSDLPPSTCLPRPTLSLEGLGKEGYNATV